MSAAHRPAPVYRYYMVFDKLEVAGAKRLGTFAGRLAEL